MDFEPFHSDDEEATTIILEKKKRDGSDRKKKGKGGPLFRSEKKDKSIDSNSPAGIKQKHSVHGVVGPADYIFDHGGSPPNETSTVTTNMPGFIQPNQTVQLQNPNQASLNAVSQAASPWPNQPVPQPIYKQPTVPLPKPSFPNPPVPSFQPNFPPTMSTKVERPHSSAALLQDRQSPQTPTPFKQPQNVTPQKSTLLAQAMGSNYGQPASPNNLTHHRNQSYSRAMSVPILHQPEVNGAPFQANFNDETSAVSHHEFSTSPIPESRTPTRTASLTTPPLTPSAETPQEFWLHDSGQQVSKLVDQNAEKWAQFSISTSPPNQDEYSVNRRESHGAESLPESFQHSIPDSTSSIDDDMDESVWCINEEQREYYTNQFVKLQPNTSDVIKGPQARDFFLKSNLPTEILSKIWHLSDLDKDFALNLDEFSIAMHLVVAVRHGVDLPQFLPPTLLPKEEEPYEVTEPIVQEEESLHNVDDAIEKDPPSEWAADFDSVDGGVVQAHKSTENLTMRSDTVQTLGQVSPGPVTIPMEARVQPISSQTSGTVSQMTSSLEQLQQPTTSPQLQRETVTTNKDSAGTAIARPRASANKNVNLMDASPWQLLPPPTKSKQTVKKTLTLEGELGSDPSLNTVTAAEHVDTLVTIEKTADDIRGINLPDDDSDDSPDEADQLKVTIKSIPKNLSKEKSRSIDSLRSDISESSEFSWRRQSLRRDSRPRSLTGSSLNEPQNQDAKVKEFEVPPIPPPRSKGHARASSLDLNQLFSAKATLSAQELKVRYPSASDETSAKSEPPQKPPRVSAPAKSIQLTSSIDSCHLPPPQPACHLPPPQPALRTSLNRTTRIRNRSFSLESSVLLDAQRKSDGLVARTEENVARKRLMSADTVEKDVVAVQSPKSKEHGVRFSEETQVMSQKKSPLERRMRKNELQASIRLLRNKNTALETLNSQLDIEWKEICEERLTLDVKLQNLKQQDLAD
ncbi:ralBP1-associated Eps domain-containing protein 1-like isoform X2 [Hydractinia symbiolongicarpus]|uniref:ralBP1-associated Eps domain-containing protein 1-like isoform X2 n=1 Tax=Hydractinia symbiolongicarpus TaxID=13093 RepID=UPI00254A7EEC|nr:ralBP1-associated Eps domain-containing protein 1-like isoform X2 [Hydractinia symbiolongicarpus]